MFSAVGFDLGDTLVEYVGVALSWQAGYADALDAVAARLSVVPSAQGLEAAHDVLIRFNTRLTPRVREVGDVELFGDLFSALGVSGAIPEADFDAGVDTFFSVFRRHAKAVDGAAATIAALQRAGASVGVLTDVAYAMPRRLVVGDLVVAGLEDLAPVTLTSVEVGWRKPGPEGFERLAGLLGVSASGMLYVGNEEKDVVGSLATGMRSCLLWRGDTAAPDWGQHLTIAALDELPALVA